MASAVVPICSEFEGLNDFRGVGGGSEMWRLTQQSGGSAMPIQDGKSSSATNVYSRGAAEHRAAEEGGYNADERDLLQEQAPSSHNAEPRRWIVPGLIIMHGRI